MTICYVLENTLYINVTNRCTNRCSFCVRDKDCGIGDVNLWLEKEPTVEEMIEDIKRFNPQKYDEAVSYTHLDVYKRQLQSCKKEQHQTEQRNAYCYLC